MENKLSTELQIDSSSLERVIVIIGNLKQEAERPMHKQIILNLIDELLKKQKLQLKDITSIKVVTNGNSFTGVRVGIAIANTLSYLLKIPVNNLPMGMYAEPQYPDFKKI